MPSYYNRVKGTLEMAKLAKASDINLIQSSVQNAISSVITDLFGPSFVLGEAENDLTLVPTAVHTDQLNTNYNEEDQWISFYERYFRQPLLIDKSSIESITLNMRNDSNLTVTVYAEIRDINYNLMKESSAKLQPTKEDDFEEITFNFNLHHLGLGKYYFVLKPIDVSKVDLVVNGDESDYDTILPDNFQVRYDRDGNYQEGLEASYNGVDYLEAYLLEDELEYEDGTSYTYENNFDLYFIDTFSSGNTYLINPGAAIIHGQKVYPIDTHVTIAGPSPLGDRTDLVILTQEGYLQVIQGNVYTSSMIRPVSDSGLKIAYITSYRTENSDWVCPNCDTTNDGNSAVCYNCGTTVNTKVPRIEQADDNGMTRMRDVLERLRRLEKMMTYEQEYNRPTRVKYTCTNDPITNESATADTKEADGTYGWFTYNGHLVPVSGVNSETKKWAIINREYTTSYQNTSTTNYILHAWDSYLPVNRPKGDLTRAYYHVSRVTDNDGNPIKGIELTLEFKKGNGLIEKATAVTNSLGYAYFDVYKQSVKTGTYKMITSCYGVKVETAVVIKNNYDGWVNVVTQNSSKRGSIFLHESTDTIALPNGYGEDKITTDKYGVKKAKINYSVTDTIQKIGKVVVDFKSVTITRKSANFGISSSSTVYQTHKNVDDVNTICGNDSYHLENINPNWDEGTFTIDKVVNVDNEYSTEPLISEQQSSQGTELIYKINDNTQNMQSEYAVLNRHFDGGFVHSITPYIKKFKNIESFKIILFRNDYAFNQKDLTRKSYQKKLVEDEMFPNIYESPLIKIAPISKTDNQGNRVLYNYHKFIVDKDIPEGNYSLLVYTKIAEGHKEGYTFIETHQAMSQGDKYGTAVKVIGTCNPSLIYMDSNSITSDTWDVAIEKISNQYKASALAISKGYNVGKDKVIRSVTLDYNANIPDGCDLKIQVSNDGGKNWITATNNLVTFNGMGNIFEWKVILRSSGDKSPSLYFDKDKQYAIQCVLNISDRLVYVPYEDYGRCLESPVMDFTAMTSKVFGDSSITRQDFSEWEWARLFMEDNARLNEIQILMSNGNTDPEPYGVKDYIVGYNRGPVYTSTPKDDWNRQIFFNQAICGLTLDDFQHTSIDYSNYEADVEPDEYNFRFKYDTEYGANTAGDAGGIIVGDYTNAMRFENHPTVTFSNFTAINASDIKYTYEGNKGDMANQYSGTHIVTAPYYGYKYTRQDENTGDGIFYNSSDDPTYDDQAIIAGMLFENGLTIDDKYTSLDLDVFIKINPENAVDNNRAIDTSRDEILYDENGQPSYNETTNELEKSTAGTYYFPPRTFSLVVSFNPTGLVEYDKTYGVKYDIDTNLYSGCINKVSIPLYNDFAGQTIYSIGIRAYDNTEEKTKCIGKGDIIGLSNLTLGAYNIRLYYPSGIKYAWKRGNGKEDDNGHTITKQKSYACVQEYIDGVGLVQMPLVAGTGHNENFDESADLEPNANCSDHDFDETHSENCLVMNGAYGYPLSMATEDKVSVQLSGNEIIATKNGQKYSTLIQYPHMVFVFTDEGTQGEKDSGVQSPSFHIGTDFVLDPYKWVRISFYVESKYSSAPTDQTLTSGGYSTTQATAGITNYTKINNDWIKTHGQFRSGEITIKFYDTDDYTNSSVAPVETFVLPAWGRIQTRAQIPNKEVNAWFKVRNGGRIRQIVIERTSMGADISYPIKFHLGDISMHRTNTVAALGSQMMLRIYPQSEANNENTKVRKFGVVYRIA